MARVTSDEVKEKVPTSITIDSFVSEANRFVTDTLGNSGLADSRLTDIELYVAAHLVALRVERGAPRYEQMGDSRMSWDLEIGPGLKMTRFGSTAILMDTTGTLKTFSSSSSPSAFKVF